MDEHKWGGGLLLRQQPEMSDAAFGCLMSHSDVKGCMCNKVRTYVWRPPSAVVRCGCTRYQPRARAVAPRDSTRPRVEGAQRAPRMHDGTQRVQTSQDHPGGLEPGPGDGPGLWARASCPEARVLFAWARDQDIRTYVSCNIIASCGACANR